MLLQSIDSVPTAYVHSLHILLYHLFVHYTPVLISSGVESTALFLTALYLP